MAIKLQISLKQLNELGVAEALARLVAALSGVAPTTAAAKPTAIAASAPEAAPAKATDDGLDEVARYKAFINQLPDRSKAFIELVREHKLLRISLAMRVLDISAPKAMGGLTGSIGRWAPIRGVQVPYEMTMVEGERAWRWLGSPLDEEEPGEPAAAAAPRPVPPAGRVTHTPTAVPAAMPPAFEPEPEAPVAALESPAPVEEVAALKVEPAADPDATIETDVVIEAVEAAEVVEPATPKAAKAPKAAPKAAKPSKAAPKAAAAAKAAPKAAASKAAPKAAKAAASKAAPKAAKAAAPKAAPKAAAKAAAPKAAKAAKAEAPEAAAAPGASAAASTPPAAAAPRRANPDLRAFERLPEKSQQFITLVAARGLVSREEALVELELHRPKELGGITEPIIRRCRELNIERPFLQGKQGGTRVWLWATHEVPGDVELDLG